MSAVTTAVAPPSRVRTRGRACDVALVHAALVVVVFVGLQCLPAAGRAAAVLAASTNLDNLAAHALRVLLLSAVVVPTGPGLLVLVLLVPVLALAQRRFGRVATLGAFAVGHVGATGVVAGLLLAGLRFGWVDSSVRSAVDVGVSYGLACVAGLLVARGPRRWRAAGTAGAVGVALVALVADPGSTAVGHLVALGLGFALAPLAPPAQGAGRPRRWEVTRPAQGGTREAPSSCRDRRRRPGREPARRQRCRSVRGTRPGGSRRAGHRGRRPAPLG
ncbi:rhomboid-like protein [Kineococcus sp. DHX-1]|uniref:rhomboid-like protein n=1 Tax=Kineococcus sp. DHX-1 TaxID=3349638 RepID=UPI0036D2DE28